MKEYFLEKEGISYSTNGFKKNRKTLVFIHGLSGSSAAWKAYAHFFEQEYNIVLYDIRGHGKSVKPKKYSAYRIRHFAEDLENLLTRLDIHSFILISHSFGTLIALEYLSHHQKKVTAAVFLSPNFSVAKRRLVRFFKPALYAGRILGVLPFSGKPRGHVDYSKYENTGDWNLRRMVADIRMTSLRVYLYCSLQSSSFTKEDFLQHIRIPVLLVHGKKDTIFPIEQSRVMSQQIKDAQLLVLDQADHILVLNHASALCDAIRQFLNVHAN